VSHEIEEKKAGVATGDWEPAAEAGSVPLSAREEVAQSPGEDVGRDAAGDQAGVADEEAPVGPSFARDGESPVPGRTPDAHLKAIIEALIFASPEPLTQKMLFKLLENEPKEDVALALESLLLDYQQPGGLQLVEVANGFQIVTRSEMHEWVRRLFHERKTQKLSVQALETLAVIAYKQPITAPEIAEIRGVNTAGVINTLMERRLIKISGRKAVVGRPFLYSTTREFLIRFGLRDLSDLPKVEDLADVLGFDAPAGLIDGTPADARLPLEMEGTPEPVEAQSKEFDTPGSGGQVH
jgi:segregation and condensation protein B